MGRIGVRRAGTGRGGRTEPLGGRFTKLWAASTTSALGSGLATIAAPLYAASLTDDPIAVSAAFAAAWLPWLLFALPGGVLADRVDRRRLMIAIDWVRVVAVAVLAAAIWTGHAGIPLLYGVLFVVNSGEIVFRAASQAMIPAVVPSAGLERANGRLFGGTLLMQGVVAGPLGGVLFAVAASIPFFVNAGTYAASAVLVALVAGTYRAPAVPPAPAGTLAGAPIDTPASAPAGALTGTSTSGPGGTPTGTSTGGPGEPAAGFPGRRRSVRAEVAEGFRWLMGQRLLRTMTILIGLLNVTLIAATAVLVLLAEDRLHLGSVGYSLLLTCVAVGGILGAAVGDRLISWVSATWTIRVGLLIEAGMHLVLALSRDAVVVGAALFVFGVHGALWGIVSNSLRQRLTPARMQGRVASTSLFIAAGGNFAGALLGGVLADAYGLTAPYWVGFGLAVVVIVTTWRVFDRATVAAAYASRPADDGVPAGHETGARQRTDRADAVAAGPGTAGTGTAGPSTAGTSAAGPSTAGASAAGTSTAGASAAGTGGSR